MEWSKDISDKDLVSLCEAIEDVPLEELNSYVGFGIEVSGFTLLLSMYTINIFTIFIG